MDHTQLLRAILPDVLIDRSALSLAIARTLMLSILRNFVAKSLHLYHLIWEYKLLT